MISLRRAEPTAASSTVTEALNAFARLLRIATLSSLLAFGWSSPGAASPLPLRLDIQDPRPARLHISATADEATLQLSDGQATLVERAAVHGASDAAVSRIRLREDTSILWVHLSGQQSYGWLVAMTPPSPVLIWQGRTDWLGDPGERERTRVQLSDRTGDGVPDVVIGQQRQSYSHCDSEGGPLYNPHALDPRTLRLRPVSLRQFTTETPIHTLEALNELPEGSNQGPAFGHSLGYARASSQAGVPYELRAAESLVSALSDQDPSTYWGEGHPGNGQWEFFSVRRAPGAGAVERISLMPRPADPPPRLGWPTRVLVTDGETTQRLVLPNRPEAGSRYWFSLHTPLRGPCLTFLFEEVQGPRRTRQTGLAEVSILTTLDSEAGLLRLIDEIVADSPEGDSAVATLRTAGARAAVPALLAAWERLSSLGMRRALRVLDHYAPSDRSARESLVVAAQSSSEEVRLAALQSLARLGELALPGLQTLISRPLPLGDEAARMLAPAVGAEALPSLLQAMSEPGGTDRPALRAALHQLFHRSPQQATEELAGRLDPESGSSLPPSVCASVALALRDLEGQARDSSIRCAMGAAPDFASRWRLIRALARARDVPGANRWLSFQAREAAEWMIRREAALVLANRGAPQAGALSASLITDPHPRVRAAGITLLSPTQQSERLVALAQRDSWPLVRAAAIKRLAANRTEPEIEILRQAIEDPSRFVREEAIQALTRLRDIDAWPAVRQRLLDSREWPNVATAAVAYVRALCIQDALPTLERIILRVYRPSPRPRDQHLAAEAALAVRDFDSRRAQEILSSLASPRAPAYLQQVIRNAHSAPQHCTASAGGS